MYQCNIPEHKQPRRFLECTDDNFLTQVNKAPVMGDGLLNLILTDRKELLGVNLGCTKCRDGGVQDPERRKQGN